MTASLLCPPAKGGAGAVRAAVVGLERWLQIEALPALLPVGQALGMEWKADVMWEQPLARLSFC